MNKENQYEETSVNQAAEEPAQPGAAAQETTLPHFGKNKRWTVRTRIGLGFAALIALFVTVIAIGLYGMNRNMKILDRIIHLRTVTLENSLEMGNAMNLSLAGLRGYMLTNTEKFKQDRLKAWIQIRATVTKMDGLSQGWTDPSNVSRFQEIHAVLPEFERAQEQAEALAAAGDSVRAKEVLTREAAPRAQKILEALEQMIASQKNLLLNDENLIKEKNRSTFRLFWGLLVLGVLMSLLVTVLTVRTLSGTSREVQQSSLKINSSSNQILAASTQHESTATEQSTQMAEIVATLNQAAATSTQLTQSVQELVRASQGIAKEAEEGAGFITDTDHKVKAMTQSNETVGNKLRTLNEKIEGVGKILTTILSVADQTNLLSLNAAIEAAKAGEQGKGFSVVAQEIRRLADQTSQSSQEISTIINEIQAASSSAIMVMDKSAQDVQESSEVVVSLSDRFSGITEKVHAILPQIETASQSINQMSAGNKQISASVSEMDKALKLTVNAAKQLRQAAYDMTAMGQQLRENAGQL